MSIGNEVYIGTGIVALPTIEAYVAADIAKSKLFERKSVTLSASHIK